MTQELLRYIGIALIVCTLLASIGITLIFLREIRNVLLREISESNTVVLLILTSVVSLLAFMGFVAEIVRETSIHFGVLVN